METLSNTQGTSLFLLTMQDPLLATMKVLLIGAGTLGCAVARNLIGWGIHHITFIDNGIVSPSNPTRQCLYTWKDVQRHGSQAKAHVAAEALKAINPACISQGLQLTIPMPGHASIETTPNQQLQEQILQICDVIDAHDVIFLMTDSRESRWLPSVLCCLAHKLCINMALGGDSLLIQQYGLPLEEFQHHGFTNPQRSLHSLLDPQSIQDDDASNGTFNACYFCTDVFGPSNSLTDRSLDQMCTTTRVGLSYIASGLAVELLINYVHLDNEKGLGPAPSQV